MGFSLCGSPDAAKGSFVVRVCVFVCEWMCECVIADFIKWIFFPVFFLSGSEEREEPEVLL